MQLWYQFQSKKELMSAPGLSDIQHTFCSNTDEAGVTYARCSLSIAFSQSYNKNYLYADDSIDPVQVVVQSGIPYKPQRASSVPYRIKHTFHSHRIHVHSLHSMCRRLFKTTITRTQTWHTSLTCAEVLYTSRNRGHANYRSGDWSSTNKRSWS